MLRPMSFVVINLKILIMINIYVSYNKQTFFGDKYAVYKESKLNKSDFFILLFFPPLISFINTSFIKVVMLIVYKLFSVSKVLIDIMIL